MRVEAGVVLAVAHRAGGVVVVSVAYRRASLGSPYSEKTRALACVYPYGPDIHLFCAPRRASGAAVRADLASAGRRIAVADMVVDGMKLSNSVGGEERRSLGCSREGKPGVVFRVSVSHKN